MTTPVLWLELRVRIRERKLWVVSLLYLLCLAGMSLIPLSSALSRVDNQELEPNNLGQGIFGCAIFTLLALLVLLGMLAGAGAIAQEREQRTLAGILNTPMSMRSIVWGKLAAVWIFLLWLTALSLPFLIFGVVWCGVTWVRFGACLAMTVAAGFVCAAVAVGLSGYFKRTLTSHLAAGTVFFFWLVVWPVLGALCTRFRPVGEAHQKTYDMIQFYVFYAHHPGAPLMLLFPGASGTPYPGFHLATAICFALVFWVVLGGIFFYFACRSLRRGLTDKS